MAHSRVELAIYVADPLEEVLEICADRSAASISGLDPFCRTVLIGDPSAWIGAAFEHDAGDCLNKNALGGIDSRQLNEPRAEAVDLVPYAVEVSLAPRLLRSCDSDGETRRGGFWGVGIIGEPTEGFSEFSVSLGLDLVGTIPNVAMNTADVACGVGKVVEHPKDDGAICAGICVLPLGIFNECVEQSPVIFVHVLALPLGALNTPSVAEAGRATSAAVGGLTV